MANDENKASLKEMFVLCIIEAPENGTIMQSNKCSMPKRITIKFLSANLTNLLDRNVS